MADAVPAESLGRPVRQALQIAEVRDTSSRSLDKERVHRRAIALLPHGGLLHPTSGQQGDTPMKALLTIAAVLALSSPVMAAEGSSGGSSRSGTANSTGPNDAGAGSSPGATGSGPTTGGMSRSGTMNSTGANDAGSGSKPAGTSGTPGNR